MTLAANWKLSNQSEVDSSQSIPCADEMGPYRIALYKGSYGLNNYTDGKPMSVFPWPQPSGPNYCGFYIQDQSWLGSDRSYLFDPQSNNATLHLWNLGSWKTAMNMTVTLKPLTYPFSAGQKTLVAGDAWGDLA